MRYDKQHTAGLMPAPTQQCASTGRYLNQQAPEDQSFTRERNLPGVFESLTEENIELVREAYTFLESLKTSTCENCGGCWFETPEKKDTPWWVGELQGFVKFGWN